MKININIKKRFIQILEQDVVDPSRDGISNYRTSLGISIVQSICPEITYDEFGNLCTLFIRGHSTACYFDKIYFRDVKECHLAYKALKEYCEHFHWKLETNEDFGRMMLK